MGFSSHVGEGIIIVVEGSILANLIDELFNEVSFFSLFPFFLRRGNWYGLGKASLFRLFDHLGSGRVGLVRGAGG